MVINDTLIWQEKAVIGLDLRTGELKWRSAAEKGVTDHSIRNVELDGNPYLLAPQMQAGRSSGVRLLDASDGSTVWQEQIAVGSGALAANQIAVQGDHLVAFARVALDEKNKKTEARPTCWRITKKGLTRLWQDEHLPSDDGPHP